MITRSTSNDSSQIYTNTRTYTHTHIHTHTRTHTHSLSLSLSLTHTQIATWWDNRGPNDGIRLGVFPLNLYLGMHT